MNINRLENFYQPLAFKATARQHVRATRYLKNVKLKAENDFFVEREQFLQNAKKRNFPKKLIEYRTRINPNKSIFSQTSLASLLSAYGIKSLNIDKLEGIQYGIDVFKNLTMREIVFLAYRTANIASKRGCPNMCAHCFHDAKPADKNELSFMPFEDFKKITNGFATVNARINKILGNDDPPHFIGESDNSRLYNRAATEVGLFYDSDGMNVIAKDKNGKEYDYEDLAEMLYNATGQQILFDTAGWNPENKTLQQRAEKYAKYFSQPDIDKKVAYNLSVNTFNPLYLKAYNLGYRAGAGNDLTNPDIQRGKLLYDKYIYRIANMLATLGTTDSAYMLMTYSTKYEKNMNGMYLSDLKLILKDVEKKCYDILKEKYPAEYAQKQEKISSLIESSIHNAEMNYENSSSRCTYNGRYQDLYNSRNPKFPRKDDRYTSNIPDINALPYNEYLRFLENYSAVIDTNGQLYYQRSDASVRSLGKELKLSTNGMKTPKIHNLEKRN